MLTLGGSRDPHARANDHRRVSMPQANAHVRRLLAAAFAAIPMLAIPVQETGTGEQRDRPPPLTPAAIAFLEEARPWLEPVAAAGPAAAPTDPPLVDAVRSRRDGLDHFVRAADQDAVQGRMRRTPHGDRILAAARSRGVDPLLVAAVVQAESGFDEKAVSPKGAVGLMQVMPKTARQFGVEDVHDPDGNLEAGACYLSHLLNRFDGDLALALAAYNAGPSSVRRFGGVPPYPETRNFTERVLRTYIEHHLAVLPGFEDRDRRQTLAG